MNLVKINFLGEPPDPSRKRFFFFLKVFGVVVVALALFLGLASSNIVSEESFLAQIPFVKRVRQLIRSADRSLEGARDDRVNILLLGMGGVGHEGPYLTDTIMLASVKPSTGQIALISIPRDLAVPVPDYGWRKINTANAYGEAREAGSGGELVRGVLADLLDFPIPYYVRIDFDGFVKLIDDVGGIDVYVERGFVDPAYPTGQNGEVRTLTFLAGWQHLDGNRALEFARSRHGSQGEGSDFARARRQQKIIEAVKERIFSLGTLRSPQKISAVLDALERHVRMNFSPWELLSLARLAGTLDTEHILTEVLDDSPEGLLAPTIGIDGAYLLVPRSSWNEVRTFVRDVFRKNETSAVVGVPIRVEVQNGTFIAGRAREIATLLKQHGFQIVTVGNAARRDYTKTVIYDFTSGAEGDALQRLRELLNAEISREAPARTFSRDIEPGELRITDPSPASAATAPAVDFLVIVGVTG